MERRRRTLRGRHLAPGPSIGESLADRIVEHLGSASKVEVGSLAVEHLTSRCQGRFVTVDHAHANL